MRGRAAAKINGGNTPICTSTAYIAYLQYLLHPVQRKTRPPAVAWVANTSTAAANAPPSAPLQVQATQPIYDASDKQQLNMWYHSYWNQYPNPSWNAGMPPMFTPSVFGGHMPPPFLPFSYDFSFSPPFTPSSSAPRCLL